MYRQQQERLTEAKALDGSESACCSFTSLLASCSSFVIEKAAHRQPRDVMYALDESKTRSGLRKAENDEN
jgi:hypothetical protein